MAITVESLLESKWREGKAFMFLYSKLVLAAAATDTFAICVGDKPVALSEINIKSDSDSLSWKAYANAAITEGSGTVLMEIPRNVSADSESGVDIEANPTVTDAGDAYFANSIDIIAQVGAGNRAYIDEDILSQLFTLGAGGCFILEIKNTSGMACKIDLNIDVIKA